MSEELRETLGRWMFERDYRERGLASPEDARWGEWVERNQEEWHQEADAVLAGPLADVLAERDRLRAALARVEALAGELLADRYDAGTPDSWGYSDGLTEAAERIRAALGSTDSDLALTERQAGSQGASDEV